MPRYGLFTPGKDVLLIVQEAGWIWKGAENLAPTGIPSPDRLAHSGSIYRSSYRGQLWRLRPNHYLLLLHLTKLFKCSYYIALNNGLEMAVKTVSLRKLNYYSHVFQGGMNKTTKNESQFRQSVGWYLDLDLHYLKKGMPLPHTGWWGQFLKSRYTCVTEKKTASRCRRK